MLSDCIQIKLLYIGGPSTTLPPQEKAATKLKVRGSGLPISPIIQKRGSSRLKGRFITANAGGIPKIISALHQPFTTNAERALFDRLLPLHQKGSRINYKGLMGDFNLAFSTQVLSEGQPPNPQDMIFSKSERHLKLYYQQLQQAGRVRENALYNAALSSPIATTSQQNGPSQLSLQDTIKRQQQKAALAVGKC